jgi:NSS family neurotransmitter:Na+ symporter
MTQNNQWSSRWMFVMAATGSAVGLGNIWKFPYIAGQHGGGAFVLTYLFCVALIGLPVLIAEIMLGRRGGASPVRSMFNVAIESGRSRHWRLLGFCGILTSFFLLSFYSVIAGWAAAYIWESASGTFNQLAPAEVGPYFEKFLSSPWRLLFWHSVFMTMTAFIVARGLRGGLEKAIELIVPSLFVILLILFGYALTTDGFSEGFAFMFKPNFSELGFTGLVVALGHAFFTLSIATASMLIYGAYLSKKTSIGATALITAILDTIAALLAGLAIFPIVFTYHLLPHEGPTLVFKTLPIAFGEMPGGRIIGTLFFLLLLLAALSSSISMVEPMVAWLIERWPIKRIRATILVCAAAWSVGIGSVLSFNLWEKNYILFGKNYYQLVDMLVSMILLPVGGLALALFAGWFMRSQYSENELNFPNHMLFLLWQFLVRFAAPVTIIILMFLS